MVDTRRCAVQAVKATAFLVLIAELMVLIVIIPFSRTWHIKKKQINYRFSFDQKLVLDRRNFCLYSQVKVTGRLTAPVGDRAAVPAGRRPGRSCQVRPCAGPTGGCALISRALRFIRSNFDNKGFISVTLTPSRKTPRTSPTPISLPLRQGHHPQLEWGPEQALLRARMLRRLWHGFRWACLCGFCILGEAYHWSYQSGF